MKKIPTLFLRDPKNPRLVTDQVTPGCEWVLAGEGRATVKWDGTSCMVREDGRLYKRREVRGLLYDSLTGAPDGFIAAGRSNGKTQGWVPVSNMDPADKWHLEAYENSHPLEPGTYELVGPKVQGNPYDLTGHRLVRHGAIHLESADILKVLSHARLGMYLNLVDWIEGIVWHHEDGRMAKIKAA